MEISYNHSHLLNDNRTGFHPPSRGNNHISSGAIFRTSWSVKNPMFVLRGGVMGAPPPVYRLRGLSARTRTTFQAMFSLGKGGSDLALRLDLYNRCIKYSVILVSCFGCLFGQVPAPKEDFGSGI